MPGALIVVSGTGTSIGKTHVCEALLRAWAPHARVVGLKPIETGVTDSGTAQTDAARLQAASSFHVKHFRYAMKAGVSPHLAARMEGVDVRIKPLTAAVEDVRRQVDAVIVELAGGLFTPITDRLTNVDLLVALAPDRHLLVAPDRLGVLHDVVAVTRALTAPSRLDGVVLVAPEQPDASTGTNATEIPLVAGITVWTVGNRAPSAALAEQPDVQRLVHALRSGRGIGS